MPPPTPHHLPYPTLPSDPPFPRPRRPCAHARDRVAPSRFHGHGLMVMILVMITATVAITTLLHRGGHGRSHRHGRYRGHDLRPWNTFLVGVMITIAAAAAATQPETSHGTPRGGHWIRDKRHGCARARARAVPSCAHALASWRRPPCPTRPRRHGIHTRKSSLPRRAVGAGADEAACFLAAGGSSGSRIDLGRVLAWNRPVV